MLSRQNTISYLRDVTLVCLHLQYRTSRPRREVSRRLIAVAIKQQM